MEEGISKLLELAVSQGIWTVLYIYLFFRMLEENKSREDCYQKTIRQLGDNIEAGVARINTRLDALSKPVADK